ncbi:MAG: protein kinase [Acidobacteriota bacterium]|nr:protein kinase [Acidobacteriota bacterium]
MGKSLKCPKCHSVNLEDSRFCSNCAAPLGPEGQAIPSLTKTLETPIPPLKKGTLFANKYKIGGEIGRGGMGVVFKAEDTKLRRPVALKLLPFEQSQSPEAKERFMREAQAAAALDHPHICTVYEVEEHDGQMYIAMAYIDGMSLKARIVQKPLKIKEALDIALQVAEGLGEAHRKGVIHRDIKPANIMLATRGGVKIMDFGLARMAGAIDLTRTDAVMGTVAYMSPEQVLGQKVDHRTDIWSFGCMVYEMLAGQGPFQGGHEQAVFQAIVHGEPEPIAALMSDIPAGLAGVLEQCLQKNALNRYLDFQALLQDLKAVDLRDVASAPAPSSHKPSTSIAVLPFTNMSPDKEQDYFAEGIAEELLNALARIHDLRVMARTSAFALKGMNLDIREIGRRLDVKAVLEGSVRKAGNRLRVTAQLINVEDGFHLWSDRYDRDMADIFAIQDEITAAIVDSLKVTLKVGEKTALRKRSTDDPEAYNLYLKGLYFLARPSPDSYEKAVGFFRAAIDKDPHFAQAYAGMGQVFAFLGAFNFAPPAEMLPKAKAAIEKALSLDENLSEAHSAAGMVAHWLEWDWEAAARSYDRALALNPGDAMAHANRGWFLVTMNRYDEAVREIKKALELDPLMPLYYAWSVGIHMSVARTDEALQELARAMEIDPNFVLTHLFAGYSYMRKGLWDEAIDGLERMKRLPVIPGWAEGVLAGIYYLKGDHKKVEQILEEMIEQKKTIKETSSFFIGIAAGLLDRLDLAFEFLDKAYEERDILMALIHTHTAIWPSSMTADPRYKALLARMKLDF